MKTHDLAAMLTSFASLTDGNRAQQLSDFADLLKSGKSETIAQRVKKMGKANGHPALLKQSLNAVKTGLEAIGAKKQAAGLDTLLTVFRGKDDLRFDEFVKEISAQPPSKTGSRSRAGKQPPEPDIRLARELADELARTVLDPASFNQVLMRLNRNKDVNSPTLAVVANRFLGNSKSYKGRKPAINDIVMRQKAEAREHARGNVLNRIGV